MNLTDAQRMVLNAGMQHGAAMWDLVKPEALDDPWRMIAFAMRALTERGQTVTLPALTSECLTRGYSPEPQRWLMGLVEVDTAHQTYLEAHSAAAIAEHVLRAKQHLESGVDPWRVVDDLEAHFHGIQRPGRDTEVAWPCRILKNFPRTSSSALNLVFV